LVFNPGSSPTFSLDRRSPCEAVFILRGLLLIHLAKASVDDGSTGDKQTSKGLFICKPPSPKGVFGGIPKSELFSQSQRDRLRDDKLIYKN